MPHRQYLPNRPQPTPPSRHHSTRPFANSTRPHTHTSHTHSPPPFLPTQIVRLTTQLDERGSSSSTLLDEVRRETAGRVQRAMQEQQSTESKLAEAHQEVSDLKVKIGHLSEQHADLQSQAEVDAEDAADLRVQTDKLAAQLQRVNAELSESQSVAIEAEAALRQAAEEREEHRKQHDDSRLRSVIEEDEGRQVDLMNRMSFQRQRLEYLQGDIESMQLEKLRAEEEGKQWFGSKILKSVTETVAWINPFGKDGADEKEERREEGQRKLVVLVNPRAPSPRARSASPYRNEYRTEGLASPRGERGGRKTRPERQARGERRRTEHRDGRVLRERGGERHGTERIAEGRAVLPPKSPAASAFRPVSYVSAPPDRYDLPYMPD